MKTIQSYVKNLIWIFWKCSMCLYLATRGNVIRCNSPCFQRKRLLDFFFTQSAIAWGSYMNMLKIWLMPVLHTVLVHKWSETCCVLFRFILSDMCEWRRTGTMFSELPCGLSSQLFSFLLSFTTKFSFRNRNNYFELYWILIYIMW